MIIYLVFSNSMYFKPKKLCPNMIVNSGAPSMPQLTESREEPMIYMLTKVWVTLTHNFGLMKSRVSDPNDKFSQGLI